MPILPPELQNTDEKYAEAVARLERLQANLEQTRELARAAQRRLSEAKDRATAERGKLLGAQRELTDALENGQPVKELQQAIAGHQANIDSLEVLVTKRSKEAVAADMEIARSGNFGSVQQDIYGARFNQLTAALAKIITPAIPICREMRELSRVTGVNLGLSGYVLNLERPQIGMYTVSDSGDLTFYLR